MFNSKNKNNLPDAFFCTSDITALGTMLALEEIGLKTPEDIGIIGYANDPFSKIIKPSLSTIEQHPQELGSKTAEIMINLLDKNSTVSKQAHKKVVITPSLIIRESSKRKP